MCLWLLSWPAASEKLRLFRAAQDVHAWLYLKERLSMLNKNVFADGANESISEDIDSELQVAPNPGQPREMHPPLEVVSVWPNAEKSLAELQPQSLPLINDKEAELVRSYRIHVEKSTLRFDDYVVIFLSDKEYQSASESLPLPPLAIIPAHARILDQKKVSLRMLEGLMLQSSRPKRWADLDTHLARYGFSKAPQDLSSSNEALVRLRADVDPRTSSGDIQVFGVQLSISQFFSAVGGLMALVSFAMIGPLTLLRRGRGQPVVDPWILVIARRRGWVPALLEGAICISTVAWVLLPLLLLLLQTANFAELGSGERLAFLGGAVGLGLSSLVHALVAWELRLIRSRAQQAL